MYIPGVRFLRALPLPCGLYSHAGSLFKCLANEGK
jgi:hypothetical protein